MLLKNISEIPKEFIKVSTGAYKQVLISDKEGPNFSMRRFIIEPGGEIPLHTNTVEHEQFILNGCASVVIGEHQREVKKNDVVFIPSGVKHSYKTMGNERFEFLCVVPNKTDKMEFFK